MAQTWNGWECDVLKALGAPCSQQNTKFLDAWQNNESAGSSHGGFNPLNVASDPGYQYWTSSNGSQIAQYPDAATGAARTAARLRAISPAIVTALQGGSILDAIKRSANGIISDLTYWLTGHRSGDTSYAQRVIGSTGTATSQGGDVGAKKGPCPLYCLNSSAIFGIPIPGCSGCDTSTVSAAVQGTAGGLDAIGKFFGKLLDPTFWVRIGEGIGGGLLILVGLFIIMRHIGLTPPSVPAPVP